VKSTNYEIMKLHDLISIYLVQTCSQCCLLKHPKSHFFPHGKRPSILST